MNPHYQQREKSGLKSSVFRSKPFPQISPKSYRHKFCLKSFFIPFFNFSHKWPTFAFTPKAGTHSAFGERSHTTAHTAKHGAFRMGVVSLPSDRSARSQTSPGRVSERHTLPLLGLGRGCSRRTQKAFGTAMRIMRVAVPRRRGPAGLRDLFTFVEIAACTPCAQGLSVCARRGVVSLPSARFTCC